MNYWQVIILGIVEGLTEFLPISSTAHMILTGQLLNIPQTEFLKSFEIAIQLGAILAVILLYWKRVLVSREIIKRVAVAFIPTAIFGFLLYKIFKVFLLENITIIVAALVLGGIVLILFEYFHKEGKTGTDSIEKISYRNCFIIGVCQALAIVPGVSRSAATILSGLGLGVKRKTIVEFSFFLAVPTMVAATGYDLLQAGFNFSADQFGMLTVGFVVAFIVALLAIKFFLGFIQKNDFKLFGVYRILIGLVFLL